MHTVYYLYQIGQFVAIHQENSDLIRYGTVIQLNCFIYLNDDEEIVTDMEYLVELYGTTSCNNTLSVKESDLSPSPRPLGG